MAVAKCIDLAGVAVITGGAAGFGREAAARLLRQGMPVALLDVSMGELEATAAALKAEAEKVPGKPQVLALKCDVTKFADCQQAAKDVAAAFPDRPVAFLFNNAGIAGRDTGKILSGAAEAWPPIFNVNLFGAMHIIKSFVPGMVKRGPLPAGKKAHIVTTSSVVGLLNHNPGAYSVSKFAVTAMCEQFNIELQGMKDKAAHISSHSLHPTVSGTDFLTARGEDASKGMGDMLKDAALAAGASTATDILDGLFRGLDEGKFYILVDHPYDVPTASQIRMRMEDQAEGGRPRAPEQVAVLLALKSPKKFEARKQSMSKSKL
eukprot:SRR837773.1748.p2 GENE.SRR837773.1748~~SRR837773.1748.p2  ORF type:complete len:337 (+),score=146.26 SRR837773.1748:53-1012(+)